MPVATKRIRERVTQMNNAWAQNAMTAVFNGISQTQFDTKIKAAAAARSVRGQACNSAILNHS
jgi:hypothetical protein